jgi:hypothetical protein
MTMNRTTSISPLRCATLALLLPLLAILMPTHAQAVDDPEFPPTLELNDKTLEKVGSGIYRFARLIKVCAAALYLPPDIGAERALEDLPKHLEIFYYRDVTAAQFIDMGDSALRKNVTRDEWDRIQPQLAAFNAFYRDVQAGDRYSLAYHPDTGLVLSLNGVKLGLVEDPEFAALYYRIWLGEQSVNNRFRDEILGLR